MLNKLKCEINSKINLNFNNGSIFHGYLMKNLLNNNSASEYHRNDLNNFTQKIFRENNGIYWEITTSDEVNFNEIIVPILDVHKNELFLENKQETVKIIKKELITVKKEELFNEYFFKENKYVKIKFKTPTAFKSKGKYLYYPNLRLIYQSIMNKYDKSNNNKIYDELALEELVKNSEIINYRLRSTKFYLEKVRIPSYIGEITVKINAVKTIVGLANFLFKYGEFSGVGIKTSLGMGAIDYIERNE